MTIWGKKYIRPLCAYARGGNFRFENDFLLSIPFFKTRERRIQQIRRKPVSTFESGSFGAVSNHSKSENSREIRFFLLSNRFPRYPSISRRLRDRRLESKRTKGMHNVTWDEIRGGMCVKRKTARRYKAVMCRLCGFPELGDLAFSRALCPSRFKGADAIRDQAGEGVNYKLERKGWKRRRRCMRE